MRSSFSCTYNNRGTTNMATSLLRLGRLGSLKCLQQESWGALRTQFTAALCTKAEEPKKPAKKAKASIVEAPEERAALLAYKTPVAFPTRLSAPGFISQGVALGVTSPESADRSSGNSEAETSTSSEAAASPIKETSESKDEESSSSSSSSDSESDSDSDSDSDDENPDEPKKIKDKVKHKIDKTETVVEPGAKKEGVSSRAEKNAEGTSASSTVGSKPAKKPKDDDAAASKDVSAPSADNQEVVDPAPTLSTSSAEEIAHEKQAEARPESVTEVSGSDPAKKPELPPKTAKDDVAASAPSADNQEVVDPAPTLSTSSAEEIAHEKQAEARPESVTEVSGSDPAKKPELPPKIAKDDVAASKDVSAPSADNQEVVDPAPTLSTSSAEEIAHEKQAEPQPESVTEVPLDQTSSEAVPQAKDSEIPETGATETPKNVPEFAKEEQPEVKTEEQRSVSGAEELVDVAPVISDAAEASTESGVAAAHQEAAPAPAAAAAPEPEPFDNSTYQNLQHHNYHTYTFIDMDVEMAKHRLPQPSTGRASPRD